MSESASSAGCIATQISMYSYTMSSHAGQPRCWDVLLCLCTYFAPCRCHVAGMLAGGSGITPMYQVAMAILKDPSDKTRISLVYGNLTVDDIMLKTELDELAAQHPQQFSVFYVLNTPPAQWSGGSGFITRAMIEAHVPPPADDVLVLRCGPGPMNDAMKEHLNAIGYDEATQQFQF